MIDIIVDNEFENLIPPLSDDEFKQLESNILADGIRDPLVVWMSQEKTILVDGHNRYKIAKKHNLEFSVHSKTFESRDDVIRWIILNQFGRRNINSFQRAELALKLEPIIAEQAEKRKHGGQAGVLLNQKSDEAKVTTSKELAKIADVSHDTIHKVKKILKDGDEKLIQDSRDKKISINKAYKQVVEKTKTKECKICGVEKDVNEFPTDTSRGVEYRRNVCNDCRNKQTNGEKTNTDKHNENYSEKQTKSLNELVDDLHNLDSEVNRTEDMFRAEISAAVDNFADNIRLLFDEYNEYVTESICSEIIKKVNSKVKYYAGR